MSPAQKAAQPQPMLSVSKVAVELGVCERSVRRWIASEELPVHRFGRSIRIARSDLEAFKRARRSVS